MRQWFYVNNDLVERKDIKDIIQCLIQSRFGIRRPSIVNSDRAQACLVAFNTVCSYISTSDSV
jgi:ERCC4-type nuclease